MRATLNLLLGGVLVGLLSAEWTPEHCPSRCICHQIFSENLRKILNSVDCQGRDMAALERIPAESEALLLTGNNIRLDTITGNLSSVQYLDLSNNNLKIHQIDSLQLLFAQLQSLKVLDLSNNQLESLISSLFSGLNKLEYLSISANNIVYIERDTFQPLFSLKTLKADRNHLRKIDEAWFAGEAKHLRIFGLSSNRIESIDASDLDALHDLELLDLAHNNITYIDPSSFRNNSVKELYLNHNRLIKFPIEALQALLNLTILRLDANPITLLGANDISNLPSLVQISITDMTELQTVQSSAFYNLPLLQRVDLSQNAKLLYIDGDAFNNTENVRFLHVHACSLRGLDSKILYQLPQLTELSFYDNPVHCNCLAEWIVQSNLTLTDGSRIACASPHVYHNAALAMLTKEELNADCSPVVISMPQERIVDYGTNTKLSCNAIGQTAIKWVKPLHEEVHSATLQLNAVDHSAEGVYTCVARSASNDSDSKSIYVRVVHTLILIRASKVSQTFVDLAWNHTSGSKYVSYVKPEGVTVRVNLPEELTEININDLVSDTTYTFCLFYHHSTEHVCVTARTLALQRNDVLDIPRMKPPQSHITTQIIIIILVIVSVVLVIAGIALVSYKKCQRYAKAKVLYKRYKNDNNLLGSTSHIKLDQCYNPTTEPLCIEEPT